MFPCNQFAGQVSYIMMPQISSLICKMTSMNNCSHLSLLSGATLLDGSVEFLIYNILLSVFD